MIFMIVCSLLVIGWMYGAYIIYKEQGGELMPALIVWFAGFTYFIVMIDILYR